MQDISFISRLVRQAFVNCQAKHAKLEQYYFECETFSLFLVQVVVVV